MSKSLVVQWKADLEQITLEVTFLVRSSHVYKRTREIVAANPAVNRSNLFYDWLARNYVHTALMGIRRQLDKDPRSVSLWRVVESMAANPDQLSRSYHLALYRPGMQDLGHKTFDKLAGTGARHYPLAKLMGAQRALKRIRNTHETYINKRVAHFDAALMPTGFPTFRDLGNAIRVLEGLTKRLHLLLTAPFIHRSHRFRRRHSSTACLAIPISAGTCSRFAGFPQVRSRGKECRWLAYPALLRVT